MTDICTFIPYGVCLSALYVLLPDRNPYNYDEIHEKSAISGFQKWKKIVLKFHKVLVMRNNFQSIEASSSQRQFLAHFQKHMLTKWDSRGYSPFHHPDFLQLQSSLVFTRNVQAGASRTQREVLDFNFCSMRCMNFCIWNIIVEQQGFSFAKVYVNVEYSMFTIF